MTKRVAFLFALAVLISHLSAQSDYNIKGSIPEDYTGFVYLGWPDGTKDSCQVVQGKFAFRGQVEHPVQCWFHLAYKSTLAWCYVEPGNFEVDLVYSYELRDNGDFYHVEIADIRGSESYQIEQFFNAYSSSVQDREDKGKLKLHVLDSLTGVMPDHPFLAKALVGTTLHSQGLTYEMIDPVFSRIDLIAQDSFHVVYIQKVLKRLKNHPVGSIMPNYTFETASGDSLDIYAFTQDYLLIDLWASWCGPCIRELPHLKSDIIPLRNENFEILSISIDKDKEKWEAATAKHDFTWPSVLGENFWQTQFLQDFNIFSIPFNILLDKDRKILAYNLEIDEVGRMIELE